MAGLIRMTTETDRDQKFKEQMRIELASRGYRNIEVQGGSASFGRGWAYAEKDGRRYEAHMIVPDNLTAIRTRHFRVKVKEVA